MKEQTTTGQSWIVDWCVACGEIITVNEWHPVKAGQTADGETTIHSFCSDRCCEKWARRGEPASSSRVQRQ